MDEATHKEAERLMESLEFTFKQHYDAEDLWLRWHYRIGIPATLTTAVTATLVTVHVPVAIVVGLAIVSSLMIGLSTFLRPDRNAAKHRHAATQMQALHERIRAWITIEAPRQDSDFQVERVAGFQAERAILLSCSPALPKWTYTRVKTGMAAGETTYKIDSK